MGTTLSARLAGGTPVLWLDFYDYAAALFAGRDGIPWFDDAAFAAFHAKAQSLLRSDVVALPVTRVVAALLAAQPALVEAMRAKQRPTYPLRRLLEAEPLRQAVGALLAPLRAVAVQCPLALEIPSPRAWLTLAWEAAWGQPLAPDVASDPDEIDGAAAYVAGFLGGFADSGIDLVLLSETGGDATPADLSLYGPVLRAARHYRWEVGLLDPAAGAAGDAGELDFRIGPVGAGGAAEASTGGMLPAEFWQAGAAPVPGRGRLTYGVVPGGAVPETVLERIAALRA